MGRTAEVIGEYFKKGKPIFIEGRLKLDSWDDKTTGKKMSKLRVVVESFEFLGSREGGGSGGEGGGDSGGSSQSAPARSSAPPQRRPPASPPRPPADPDLDVQADDVPF